MTVDVDVNLDKKERAQLSLILGCTPETLEASLAPYAGAALEEYLRMFLGQRVFTRGSDILEYRLFLLVKAELEDRLPDEQRVSALFQTSLTSSRGPTRLTWVGLGVS